MLAAQRRAAAQVGRTGKGRQACPTRARQDTVAPSALTALGMLELNTASTREKTKLVRYNLFYSHYFPFSAVGSMATVWLRRSFVIVNSAMTQ